MPAHLIDSGWRVAFRSSRNFRQAPGRFTSRPRRSKCRQIMRRHAIRFTRIPSGAGEVDWHTVPERVLTVRLDGSAEYQTSDGDKRRVPASSFVLFEDTHGKGHTSRHSPEEQTVIWINLPHGLDNP